MSGAITTEQATPVLTINGSRATISSVLFSWMVRCSTCRKCSYLYSVGQIVIDLNFSTSRKSCKWSYRTFGGKAPLLPAQCPECSSTGHNGNGYWVNSDWHWMQQNPNTPSKPGYGMLYPWPSGPEHPNALQQEAYDTLRATFPLESAKADAAMHAELRRP
jgi:hypothetical protein